MIKVKICIACDNCSREGVLQEVWDFEASEVDRWNRTDSCPPLPPGWLRDGKIDVCSLKCARELKNDSTI